MNKPCSTRSGGEKMLLLWAPENQKLYKVTIETEEDTLLEEIDFRCMEVAGTKVLLNKKSVFFKGVDIHEERPMKAAKAYSEADAQVLLTWAKELECNFVRLVHYPHDEHMVKLAEKMGLMVWMRYRFIRTSSFHLPVCKAKWIL